MKRVLFFSLLMLVAGGNAFADIPTVKYVNDGLLTKQDSLVSSESVTVSGNKLNVVSASATTPGIAKLGTIPSGGESSTTTATIWVE